MPEIAPEVVALRLSDDEVLALAAHADKSWPSPLPTVDLTSREEVLSAVSRGWRSLAIRELVDDDRLTEALAVVTQAMKGGVLVRAFSSESGLVPSSSGAFTTFVGTVDDGGVIVNVATPTGVHAVGQTSMRNAAEMIRRAAEDAFESERTDGEAAAPSFCVVGASPALRAISVGKGVVTLWSAGPDEKLVPGASSKVLAAPLAAFLDAVLPD